MPGKIYLVSGGTRSGKSLYAEQLVQKFNLPVYYIATAEITDQEMQDRVKLHQQRRPATWETFEQPYDVSRLLTQPVFKNKAILLDCLTVYVGNMLWKRSDVCCEQTKDYILAEINSILACARSEGLNLVIVTSEVGLGLVPENGLSRYYRDVLGEVNQAVARAADEVYFVSAGIPLALKRLRQLWEHDERDSQHGSFHRQQGDQNDSLPGINGQAGQLMGYRSYEGKLWRRGYTTGACAAAAAKGAVLAMFKQERPEAVEITTPVSRITIPIAKYEVNQQEVTCSVIKDGGDDPDITNGLEIRVTAVPIPKGITISGGHGVGKVTKAGLAVPPGQPAINPVPRKMIIEAVQNFIPEDTGVALTISVPEGDKVALKTLNPKLGIRDGISILGTTGIVEPMSEEAFKSSLVPQIDIALAAGYRTLVLTPGRMGQRSAIEKLLVPETAVVQMSNFVGFMLQECCQRQVNSLILCGHLGKLIKVAGGIFHTHSKVADARLEILAAHLCLYNGDTKLVEEIMQANTIEEAVSLIKNNHLDHVFKMLAAKVSKRAAAYVEHKIRIGTILTSLNGEILARDTNADILLQELGCGSECLL